MEPNNVFKIDVNGVIADKREESIREIRDFFEPFSSKLGISIEVIVTQSFDKTVGRILSDRSGVKIPYIAKQTEVIACGKTIPYRKDDRLAFIVIFDASVFGNWENEQVLWRSLTFSHEEMHVMDEQTLCDDIGIDAFLSEPITVEDIFFRLGHNVWMEYDAERYSIEIFVNALKKVSPDATVNFSLHQRYAESFVNLLESLPKFIYENINGFMNWKMTMDTFWPKMYLKLREVFVLAAFTSAHSDALDKIDEKLSIAQQNKRYSFFFNTWHSIETDLRVLYQADKRYDRNTLVKISNKLRSFYERCGMILSNVQNGVYVAVRPVNLTNDS